MAPVPRHRLPSVAIAGAGAAGLWSALALLEAGWPPHRVAVFEPDAKEADDHTWGYWARESLLPGVDAEVSLDRFLVRAGGRDYAARMAPYRYFSLRSSAFYGYARRVLAQAGVPWTQARVGELAESSERVTVHDDAGRERGAFDYVLDSRPVAVAVGHPDFHATVQHFGGFFVEAARDTFDEGLVVLMDFEDFAGEVGFFYVVPYGPRRALVELAIVSEHVWPRHAYDGALHDYLERHYPGTELAVAEREYGAIPMTDEPLWRASTPRVWRIGTAGGWVQPSSGYAFTRCARFGREVAGALSQNRPRPWRPSPAQQTLNSVMLGYMIDEPRAVGGMFVDWFADNGPGRAFAFLDEATGPLDTLRLMWRSPKAAFTPRAIAEVAARVSGRK